MRCGFGPGSCAEDGACVRTAERGGGGSAALLPATVSLLPFPLLIDALYRLERLRKRGRKSSASHRSAEFVPVYSTKIKLLRND